MFTHTCMYKHTHLPDQRDWPSLSPLSLRVCSGLEGTPDKHFARSKNFPPLPALFSVLPSPLSTLSLVLHCCFHPPTCTPFYSFRHGPAHPTPHSGAPFSTNVSDVKCIGCEGLFPSVQHIQSLSPIISSIFRLYPLFFHPFGSLDHKC